MIVLKVVSSFFVIMLSMSILFGVQGCLADLFFKAMDRWWGRWFFEPLYWGYGAACASVLIPGSVVGAVWTIGKIWGAW